MSAALGDIWLAKTPDNHGNTAPLNQEFHFVAVTYFMIDRRFGQRRNCETQHFVMSLFVNYLLETTEDINGYTVLQKTDILKC